MNDRLKYRIWWKSRQKYIDDRMLVTPTGRKLWSGMTIPVLPSEDDDFVVEFCTGLSDKNGNLIYEGDIVRQGDILKDFPIRWNGHGFNNPSNGLYPLFLVPSEWEIIGNIHEQAEQKDK